MIPKKPAPALSRGGCRFSEKGSCSTNKSERDDDSKKSHLALVQEAYMSIELDRPGGGVAAFMLSLSTLLALEKNGTLADDELSDIVEQSLARLKAIDAET